MNVNELKVGVQVIVNFTPVELISLVKLIINISYGGVSYFLLNLKLTFISLGMMGFLGSCILV